MADTKISALSAASALSGTELVEVVQGGANKKTTPADIAALAPQGDVVGPASAVDADIALFDTTTGKKIKDSGVKLSTDGTLASNSDNLVPTQKAVKTYADGLIAASDAMVFKGVTDCSANPNYPAADRGHTYRVSVAGKIGGASGVVVEAGDMFICLTDGTASGNQATVGANWGVIQMNLDGALLSTAIGVTVQGYDPMLDALAALISSANKGLMFTGADTPALFDLTAFALTLLDDANQAGMRTTLGLTPGTDVQAYNALLAALAALSTSADKGLYFTGSNVPALFDLSSFARTFLDDASAPAVRDTLKAVGSGPQSTTAVDVTNTTTKTEVLRATIPANSITGTKAVSCAAGGFYLNNSTTTKTLLIEIKLGSTVLWSGTTGNLNSAAPLHAFNMHIHIVPVNGASNAQIVHGVVGISGAANSGTGAGDPSAALTAAVGFNTPIAGPSTSGSAEDATTDLDLVVSVQHSAAHASTTFRLSDYHINYHP